MAISTPRCLTLTWSSLLSSLPASLLVDLSNFWEDHGNTNQTCLPLPPGCGCFTDHSAIQRFLEQRQILPLLWHSHKKTSVRLHSLLGVSWVRPLPSTLKPGIGFLSLHWPERTLGKVCIQWCHSPVQLILTYTTAHLLCFLCDRMECPSPFLH